MAEVTLWFSHYLLSIRSTRYLISVSSSPRKFGSGSRDRPRRSGIFAVKESICSLYHQDELERSNWRTIYMARNRWRIVSSAGFKGVRECVCLVTQWGGRVEKCDHWRQQTLCSGGSDPTTSKLLNMQHVRMEKRFGGWFPALQSYDPIMCAIIRGLWRVIVRLIWFVLLLH